MNEIYLLLGSNEGDGVANLAAARVAIEKRAGSIIRKSSVYKSAAWGLEQQADFRNQALQLVSNLSPEALLETVLDIERTMGRVRLERWGPRIIDIDVLFYGDRVVESKNLSIPHPRLTERRFVLQPLAEIAPRFIHPILGHSVAELLRRCPDPLDVSRLSTDDGAL